MHLHTFVDRVRKRSKNGDEVVVHDVIQITGDPSTERTAPPRSTHVRNSHVSSFLIQQGQRRGRGRWHQQQHDSVVLMELQYSGRASPSAMEEEEVLEREKEATKGQGVQV